MSVLEVWAQPYLWAGGKCGMTAIFWWFNFKSFGIKLLGGSWWKVWQRLKWRVTAQIQYGYNGHFPSLQILAVTYCLCFHFLLQLSEFCYLSHQTGMFRRKRTCDVLKTKPTQNPKYFKIILLFVSEQLRALRCVRLLPITCCREWLQDPSASGAWKFHTQFLALHEYAARFAKIQKIVCRFKKPQIAQS